MNKFLVGVCATLFAVVFTMGPLAAQGIWGTTKDATDTSTTTPAEPQKAADVVKPADVSKSEVPAVPAVPADVHQPATVTPAAPSGDKDVKSVDQPVGCPAAAQSSVDHSM